MLINKIKELIKIKVKIKIKIKLKIMLKVYRIKYYSYITSVRSYTLFGLFCWAYYLIRGEQKLLEFLQQYSSSPFFVISSPFPVINNIPLLPKPLSSLQSFFKYQLNLNIKEKFNIKQYNKCKLVSVDVFKNIIETNENLKLIDELRFFNNIIIKKEEKDYFRKLKRIKNMDIILTKNFINRINNYSRNLYFEEALLKLIDDYFLVYFYDDNYINEFEYIMNIASNLGLGGNKNTGWGKISIKFDENITKKIAVLNILQNSNSNKNSSKSKVKFITLSPIIVNPEVINFIDFSESFYELETYKSYSESAYKKGVLKNKVLYLKEGSIISIKQYQSFINNYKFIGYLKDVGNNIRQYGLEFPIEVI